MMTGPYPTLPDDYGVHDRGGERGPQIRHTEPRVADHCARMLLKYGFDYRTVATAMLASKIGEWDDERKEKLILSAAQTLQKSPYIAKAQQDIYASIGMNDAAFQYYLAVQWEVYHNGNDKRWPVAARILGEIFGIGKKKDEASKPKPLPIQGFDEGVQKMFKGAVLPAGDLPTDIPSIDDEDVVN